MGEEDFESTSSRRAWAWAAPRSSSAPGELLGRTPLELLMERRLERAAELLAAAEGNVGEAAYAVASERVALHQPLPRALPGHPFAWRRGDRTPAGLSSATT